MMTATKPKFSVIRSYIRAKTMREYQKRKARGEVASLYQIQLEVKEDLKKRGIL